jgi:hypothetical protein
MKTLKFILLFLTFNLASQETTGFVYNNGNPISNVNIFIKDSNIGTLSDENGQFTLEIKNGDIIILSHLSMHTKQLKINKLENIKINLDAKVTLLDEINLKSSKTNNNWDREYIQTAYGKLNPRSAGFAIYSFNKEDIENFVALNVPDALVGRVPGYTLTSEGAILRGGAFAAWDIDGVVFNDLPTFLDISTVESIHVIKSSAFSVMYGPKGYGGVIVINTFKNSTLKAFKKSYPQLYFVKEKEIELPNKGKEVSEMIKESRDDLDNLRLMAYIYKSRGDINSALRIYRLILAYEPNNFISYRDIAASLLETNEKNKAWDIYKTFIQENREDINETYSIMFNDIERLYHSNNLKKIIGNEFVSKKNSLNNYKNQTRIVFEWSVPNETLQVEVINPEKQSIELQLGSNFQESYLEEFFIDETLKGDWELNLSILEGTEVNGYLKITIYRNWILPNKILPETKFFLLSGTTQTKYKLLNLKI